MSQDYGYFQWPLISKYDSPLIGYCGFVPSTDGAEIGWRLAPSHWGQGLATEGAQAIGEYAFNQLGYSRIIVLVDRDNAASIRVATKIGMTFEKEGEDDKGPYLLYSMSKLSSSRRR